MSLLDEILQRQLSKSGELSLVTSVLGASASWFGHSIIAKVLSAGDTIIHVSFIHEATFHSDGVRKLGIDLAQHERKGKFMFIDGLSGLFYEHKAMSKGRNLAFTGRKIQHLSTDIKTQIKEMNGSKVYLIIESPDLLLSAGELSSFELISELLEWHKLVFHTMVMVNADSALVSRAQTRLEMEGSSFVTTLAHNASCVTSLRMLDTGLAKDISGILRITSTSNTALDDHDGQDWSEKEVLYFVKDGSVEVFDRGEMRP